MVSSNECQGNHSVRQKRSHPPKGTRAQSPVVPPSLTDSLSVHFVPTIIGCPVNAGLAESATFLIPDQLITDPWFHRSAQERTSAAAFRVRLAVYDLTSLADVLSPTFLRHCLCIELSAGDEFCQGSRYTSNKRIAHGHIRLSVTHPLPLRLKQNNARRYRCIERFNLT